MHLKFVEAADILAVVVACIELVLFAYTLCIFLQWNKYIRQDVDVDGKLKKKIQQEENELKS